MRLILNILVVTALLFLCVAPGTRAAENPAGGTLHFDRPLVEGILRAGGKGDAESLLRYESMLRQVLGQIEREVGRSRSPYRIARRIHFFLHGNLLRRYAATADGLDAILDRGEFNCVSASLLYGIIARAFGFEAEVLEIPRHVYVRLEAGGRIIDIESTSRVGFDLGQHLDPVPPSRSIADYSEDSLGAGGSEAGGQRPLLVNPPRVVNLEEAVAFVWYNAGRRQLESGEPLQAALRFQQAARLQPELASGSGALASLMARAFRNDYEAGEFDSAFRIAEIGLEIFPGTTSSRDRLLAAATKRIGAACDAGDPARAEEILDRASATVRVRGDQVRLSRGACPRIAAAAVRMGDWERAARMVSHYAAVEPDPVETSRLARWVAAREREAAWEQGKQACADLPQRNPLDFPICGDARSDPAHPEARSLEGAPPEPESFGRDSDRAAGSQTID